MPDTTVTTQGRWYPNQPPALPGESDDAYTNRLLARPGPYDHPRRRQCSIGWHNECSDRTNSGQCGCPCHEERREAHLRVADWNARYPAGTKVTLPQAPKEKPTVTTGPAYVAEQGMNRGWPVIPLVGFAIPIWLSWVQPEPAEETGHA